jgi:uncharacterized protein (TIGR02145 family)
MIGKQIEKYTIISHLGEGGMASVYMANDNKFDTNVAIKVLNKEYVHNENIRKRFLAEAKNMFKMSHPNIIKVNDLIDDGDTVAFVMEHIEGETLKEHLDRKGKLSDDEIKTIFSQMLEAVGYVHDKKLVHRDIKPSNFMINSEGQVKLLDFGIAKNTDSNSADYTQTGTMQNMGTPMYMSPEQIKSTKDVTLQSDIYSLGVVLWQMVMGKKPYDTNTSSTYELQNKIVTENLSLTNSKFDSIIEVATAKELNIRFNTCNELKSKLESLNKEGLDNTKSYSSEVSEKTILNDSNEKTIIESAQKSNTPSKPQIEITQTQLKQRKISPVVYVFIGIILITIYGVTRPYKEQSITNTEDNTTAVIPSVVIGNQEWMVTNLNVETFRNGVIIPEAKTNEEWIKAAKNKEPAWCYYDNDPTNGAKYGKLYNWYSVNDLSGLAPEGWHIPSNAEWNEFVNYIGGFPINKKDINRVLVTEMLLSGVRCGDGDWDCNGDFLYGIGNHGGWWASDNYTLSDGIIFDLNCIENTINTSSQSKGFGYSVMCIKDKKP